MLLKNALGGIALIAGTAIGAAVLALPVVTAHLGFYGSIFLYLLCWFFMTVAALYLLEVNLSLGRGLNLVSLAEQSLGPWGKYFTGSIYLILVYALTAAYLLGLSDWLQQGLAYGGIQISTLAAAIFACLLMMALVWLGTRWIDWLNRLLVIGLVSAFGSLILLSAKHIDGQLLHTKMVFNDLRPIPMIITGFGSAIVIPTLTHYLPGKARSLLWVVILGGTIPLLVYSLWELTISGLIPLFGENGLLAIQAQGHAATQLTLALNLRLNNPVITDACAVFSLFALSSSLLGVCLALFDFLRELLGLDKSPVSRLKVVLLTFIPPLGFVLFYPNGFVLALSFAGIFVAILLGILPVMMAWQLRYRQQLAAPPLRIWGGKPLLSACLFFFLGVCVIEAYHQFASLWPTT